MRHLLNVIFLLHHSQTIVLGAMMLPSSVADIPSAAATTTTTLYAFNGLFSRTTWVSRYQKDKTSLDLNEARDYGVWDAVESADYPAMPAPHHSVSYISDSLPANSVKALKVYYNNDNDRLTAFDPGQPG